MWVRQETRAKLFLASVKYRPRQAHGVVVVRLAVPCLPHPGLLRNDFALRLPVPEGVAVCAPLNVGNGGRLGLCCIFSRPNLSRIGLL